jgi:hypothetical protein
MAWNPPYPEIIRDRIRVLDRLRSNPKLIAAAKIHYRTNPVDFINDWAWTYDPRVLDGPQWMPFILWPKQEEFISWLHDRYLIQEDGLVEKSRGVGATWLASWFSIWGWLFLPGFKAGWGSRKQDLVDKIGDPDSIFEKIRMALERLPGELLPQGWNPEKHSAFLKLRNPATEATITGEAGDNIGRGGRNTMYFVDEAAFLERPLKADASLSENTNCRIDISTVNGIGNPFHSKRFGGAVPVFIFDWRDDPNKGDEWYAAQEAKLDPVVLAQEVDRDYEASAEDMFIPAKWVKAAVGLKLPRSGERVAGLDVADEGPDSNAYVVRHGPVVESPEEWKRGTTTQTARRAATLCQEGNVKQLNFDKIGVGAGVRGELDKNPGGLSVHGVDSGASPTKGWYIKPNKKQKEKGKTYRDAMRNLKAQLWWMARQRFRKTYEHVNGIKEYPLDELISLPEDAHELAAELSCPRMEHTENGLIKVESKKKMKARGIKSPNLADAFILTLAPSQKPRKVGW